MSAREPTQQPCFEPMVARSRTLYAPSDPVAYDCFELVFVRSGSALLLGEFGRHRVADGDVVLLASSTLCGFVPEPAITTTTFYLDRDYLIDQAFWLHSATLTHRNEASRIIDAIYAEPAQVLRIGTDRTGYLSPWLDEFVSLSIEGLPASHFFRMQSLLFAVIDVIASFVSAAPQRTSTTQRRTSYPAIPRHRRFAPLREEARRAASFLHAEYERRWTLASLAHEVHLSPSQLGRVFVESFGKSPIAYLTMVRVEQMAVLLRETDEPVSLVARRVGWTDPDYATRQFRRGAGMTPRQCRALSSRAAARN